MKKNKFKSKKGMTLIEVIISVTLLSILIVPISGFMISSLKNSANSQKEQEASYIGQKILEELKAYENISLKTDNKGSYFELLDGDKIYKDPNSNSFNSIFERNIYGKLLKNDNRKFRKYKVELNISENSNFKYNDISSLDINNDADFKIDFINENNFNYIRLINNQIQNKIVSSKDISINIEEEDDEFILSIYDKNNLNSKIENVKEENKSNKILLYVNSEYNIETNIELNNNTGETIYFYIIKQGSNSSKINIISTKGRIILSEENEIYSNKIGSIYQYTVKVKDGKENILFEAQSSSNINIR